MLLISVRKTFSVVAATCLLASPALAQEINETLPETTATAAVQTVPTMLSAEGELSGTVIAPTTSVGEISEVANAKVSLVSQGKVIDVVTADEAGVFSFANVNPGEYQVVGSANGLVGSQTFKAASFSKTATAAPSKVVLQPAASQSVYESYGSAPVSSFMPSSTSTCNTCSAGGGSFGGRIGGGGIGSRLGGGLGRGTGRGLLARPGLLLGLGGLAFIDDDDDASPDQ
jgi:hypothetical protein